MCCLKGSLLLTGDEIGRSAIAMLIHLNICTLKIAHWREVNPSPQRSFIWTARSQMHSGQQTKIYS